MSQLGGLQQQLLLLSALDCVSFSFALPAGWSFQENLAELL